MSVLFLIGQGLEQPSIIDEMLDPLKISRKPLYNLANETPLILVKCNYDPEPQFSHINCPEPQFSHEAESSLNVFAHFRVFPSCPDSFKLLLALLGASPFFHFLFA